ncbi:hypothetical protein, partial [Mycobacterium gordonae]|uniref:hypothetical protein n=1 Tax=Mycobacterium gordonae TaxID=1778 RepID=UPI000AD6678F
QTPIDGREPTCPVDSSDEWRRAWQAPVDQLASGGEYRLRRIDLPEGHVEYMAGDPDDEFVLTVANDLRPA